jgi:hypothetical protein
LTLSTVWTLYSNANSAEEDYPDLVNSEMSNIMGAKSTGEGQESCICWLA